MKTDIILATVTFLGFLSRPELVISYLPPGMASKINTKGKRLCIPLLHFGVAEICVGGGFWFVFELFKIFNACPPPKVNISLAVSYCSHLSFICPQLCWDSCGVLHHQFNSSGFCEKSQTEFQYSAFIEHFLMDFLQYPKEMVYAYFTALQSPKRPRSPGSNSKVPEIEVTVEGEIALRPVSVHSPVHWLQLLPLNSSVDIFRETGLHKTCFRCGKLTCGKSRVLNVFNQQFQVEEISLQPRRYLLFSAFRWYPS